MLTFDVIKCKMRSLSIWKVQSFGVIAQLVEHLLCKQGVTGSSPVTSTTMGQ